MIGRIPEDSVDIGRGIQAPRWFRRMTHINLPDADAGYAVMDIGENEREPAGHGIPGLDTHGDLRKMSSYQEESGDQSTGL